MKAYRVFDNCEQVIATTDRLKMLEKLYELVKKYEDKQSWFWADEEELR